MASIRTAIELEDRFSGVLNSIISAVNLSAAAIGQMQGQLESPVDTAAIEGIHNSINQATIAAQELSAAMETLDSVSPAQYDWREDFDVFTNSGVERFKQEIESVNSMMTVLGQTQAQIAQKAANSNILPANAISDMNTLHSRLMAIQQRIQAIEGTPMRMRTDEANTELEKLRGQLYQAVQQQEALNQAVDRMDVRAANEAYLQLSQTVSDTERHIRDNTNQQGLFNRQIESGVGSADKLKSMIKGAVGAFAGLAGVKKAISFVEECTEAFDTQLNAETQLMGVLSNTFGREYAVDITAVADISGAVNEINDVQGNVSEITVPLSVRTETVNAAFNDIKDKAAEIQSRGIYGDEAMIAAGAEFSTYFTDTGAIEMMMDTLSNYAMGMENGVSEVGSDAMVQYATNLGKIMTGSYQAMTEKGFKFTDAQKAIIEGTATQEQIVGALGEEYLSMSQDMQAAATISAIIGESWDGLYEKMSNTPQGQIIQMTNAWGDMKEVIGGQLYPYVLLFVNAVTENWGTIESITQGITTGLQFMLGVLSWLVEGAFAFAQTAIDNWSTVSTIIMAAGTALLLYKGFMIAYNAVQGISNGLQAISTAAHAMHSGATLADAAATTTATGAQVGLNSALLACPLTWIILLVIALTAAFLIFTEQIVGAVYWIGALFKNVGLSIANFGIAVWNVICEVGQWFQNLGMGIWNVLCACANNVKAAFVNAWIWIQEKFWDFVAAILNGVVSISEKINSFIGIFGIEIDTSGIEQQIDNIAAKKQDLENSKMDFKDIGEEWNKGWNTNEIDFSKAWNEGINTFDVFESGWGSEAYNAGAKVGAGIHDTIMGVFDMGGDLFGIENIPSAEDYANIYSGVNNIDDNTAAISDSLSMTDEELKYLRDIAERETINRFTTAEITIEQTNNNNISSDTDLDGLMERFTDDLTEAVFIVTEGVHA